MKKLLYILSLVLITVSCADELVELKPIVDSNKVTIDFSVSIAEVPIHTKAFADAPALTNLYLAVFDENGFLVEYVPADSKNTQYATSNGTSYKYSVSLTLSDTKRIIHFLANAPTTLRYGTEEEVITALYTEGTNDAYWYRKEVNGIKATLVNKVLVPTDDTKTALTNIPLVRNFAKIEVATKQGCAFTLQSYAVINAPNKGSVAAYSRTTGRFVDYLNKTTEDLRDDDKYDAFVPGDATLNSDITNLQLNEITSPSPSYIYERETPIANPVYILVYGQFGGNNVYYRVDLRDDDGNYFPLLRNFKYKVTINEVTHTGYSNPQDAANSVGSGDISSSIETEHLTNISDGEIRLTVDYTSKVLVTDNNVDLKYKLEKLEDATLNSVKITCEGEALRGIVVNGQTVKEQTVNNPQLNAWITLDVDPAQIGAEQKTGTITIVATYNGDRTIQRKVTYTLRRPYEMDIKCVPEEIPYGINEKVKVDITIPDDLGSSMFPLEFNIEAQNLSITPDNDNLPVASGLSTIPGVNKSAFWFVKSLSKEEYDALQLVDGKRTFQCHFKANKRESATRVYVTNPYFVAYVDDILTSVTGLQPYDVDDFGNYEPRYFQELKYSEKSIAIGTDKPTRFTFNMTAVPEGPVTVTLINARPADTETDLTNGEVDKDGNAVFKYNTNTTSGSFDLLTTTEDKAVVVKLEATHFQTASLDAGRDWMFFDEQKFNTSRLLHGIGRTVSISFEMDDSDPTYYERDVTVSLNGLKTADGKTTFTVRPSSGTRLVNVQNLVTTNEEETVSFTIYTPNYREETVSLTKSYGSFNTIEFNKDYLGLAKNEDVQLTFSLSDYETGMTLCLDLKGLVPAAGSGLTLKDGTTSVYEYQPTSNNCAINLKTASDVTSRTTCSVQLSANGYKDSKRITIDQDSILTIPKGNLICTINDRVYNTAVTFANGGRIQIYSDGNYTNVLTEYSYTRSNNNKTAENNGVITIVGVSSDATLYIEYTYSSYYYTDTYRNAVTASSVQNGKVQIELKR